jgi:ABC-type bacteriocin/lantibiotic exporter with double-glycine peptidase domain
MSAASGMTLPMWGYFFAQVITGAAEADPSTISSRFRTIAIRITWVAANVALSETFCFLSFSYLAARQMARLKQQYLRAVLGQELAWHEGEANQSAASRLSTHVPKVKAAYGIPISHALAFFSKACIALIIGLSASWQLMLTLLTMVPVMWISFMFFGRLRSQNSVRSARAYLQASRVSDEIVSLLDTIRAFCSFNVELDRCISYCSCNWNS